MKPFDAIHTPLRRGVTLIEASAGTGKTYSIAALFLRLILEENIQIQEILTVTYTVAATQELRDRIRKRLREAAVALRQRLASGDPIVENYLSSGQKADEGIRRVELASQCFDEAHIFTIHGFCQRALKDHAFESGTRYEAEVITETKPLFQEVAHDFWRRCFYYGEPLFASLALARKESPSSWVDMLERTRNHPGLKLLPEPDQEPWQALGEQTRQAFERLRCEWPKNSQEVIFILREDKALSRKQGLFGDPGLDQLLAEIIALFSEPDALTPSAIRAIHHLSTSSLAKNVKENKTPPSHPFFELCEAFVQTATRYFSQLKHEFLAYASDELSLRKLRRNVRTYDDLLTSIHRALNAEYGPALTATLGGRYKAALIDEFQDTDPLQYEIFSTLFANREHWLFFIGDPKQAIYGFRGADIFTYLKAAAAADEKYTLRTNWRSDALLLDGFNRLFTRRENPLVIEAIAYETVAARPVTSEQPFPTAGDSTPPLSFRFIHSQRENGKPHSKAEAQTLVASAVAADIAKATRWKVSDIAILVRDRYQAAEVQSALRERGVKSVLQSNDSVFHSDQATELQRLLEAVLDPPNRSKLNTALCTSFFGLGAIEIAELDENEAARQRWIEQFLVWRDRWENNCFIAMFRQLVTEQNIRQKLVTLADGERRLTNTLHLAELLHQSEAEERLTPEGLSDWLRDQRKNVRSQAEAAQLRLESDEDAVTITTIHKSKGLEYPVVYCPFLWQAADSSMRNNVQFHDDEGCLNIDLRGKKGAHEEHLARHAHEALAEDARLLYVAVTRAKHRCIIYAGEFLSAADNSALGYLFSRNLLEGMRQLAESSPEAICFSEVIDDRDTPPPPMSATDVETFEAKEFHGKIVSASYITSFSGLIAGTNREEPEQDRPATSLDEPQPGFNIFNFERGPRAGNLFHDILQHLDFQSPESLDLLLPAKLSLHGFANSPFQEAVRSTLCNVLNVELQPGMRLRDVPPAERLSEVEFSHRLTLTPAQLHDIFNTVENARYDEMNRLSFSPVTGFLRGFIDLLFRFEGRFYVLDWKSNWLGNRLEDYQSSALQASMQQHHYTLQYHLYTLATDRFLQARLPGYDYEQHFGGVFYLFLRGIDPANPACGIFRDRPSLDLVKELRKLTV